MKYGYCTNHSKRFAVNAKKLCTECTRERHRKSAESKGFTIKEKSNEHRGIESNIYTRNTRSQDPNEPFQSSQRFNKKKAYKINNRSEKGKATIKAELLLFQKIFQERDPKCEWCKAPITVFSPINYHHLKTKGSHPELRLVESNIVKICDECHMKEHGFNPRK